MSKKIFRAIISVAMVVLFASLSMACSFLYNYFSKSQISQLNEKLLFAVANANETGAEYLERFDFSTYRYTLIAPDGRVLYDSQADIEQMENHLDREEVAEALQDGTGSSARYSATLTRRTVYEAARLDDGNVLRISISQITIGALVLGMLPAVSAIALISVAVSMLLSHRMASSIVKPLYELDLENPARQAVYEELTPILTKIRNQRRQIDRHIQELRQKSDEFRQITASMNEGLVLLDQNGFVISINAAAKKLFNTDDTAIGRDFLIVVRTANISRAVVNSLDGKKAEFREEINGREYQFVVERTESEGKAVGVVILSFDVSEMARAERSRREFTANVSHELKTPLQSIIGSAELLESGLVKPEDTQRFVGNIKGEARRLVSLINDIIRLSQLDENSEPATETVDLWDTANEVMDLLQVSAAKKQVELELVGAPCTMTGIRRYIYEIIYNLCDNAIRYNKEGGKVKLEIRRTDDRISLSVTDTGIGIPQEHQSRIFERFYRVDKSHSKETGGTGLGLSIVKHAVAYHKGTIRLDSKPDVGTTITVEFGTV
ncbi:MAG: two-component sensor histidine kinase [Clostridia bacterium]|nr:two-component sensor histidine kinase [Clostridia bacterium]